MTDYDSRYQDADRLFAQAHTYTARRQVDLDENDVPIIVVRDTVYHTVVQEIPDGDVVDEYMARDGESMHLIANRFLGSPSLWWRVADANPQVRYPLDLKMADLLVVPE